MTTNPRTRNSHTPADVLELARSVVKHAQKNNAVTIILAREVIRLREGLGKPRIYRTVDKLHWNACSPYDCVDAILRDLGLVP